MVGRREFLAGIALLLLGCGSSGIGSTAGQTAGAPPPSGSPSINYATARLTNSQYLNTVHDLLPNVTFGDPSLPNENVVAGFFNASSGQTATAQLIENYQSAAEQIALAASKTPSSFLPCQPAAAAEEDACAQTFVTDFGKRAYRRPLTNDENARMLAFYQSQRKILDFPTSIGTVMQVFLQSPSFLYRLEVGSLPSSGSVYRITIPLTSYELATRLSYFLTNSMPDAELTNAADRDLLVDPKEVESQARRLLADPRARAAVASFNYQWLKLSKTENMTKNTARFPGFTPAIAHDLHDSAVAFIDHVFWGQGTLTALLTAPEAYVTDAIAPYYGVPTPGASTLQLVGTNPKERTGILTQAGFLAGLSGPVNDSPVQRGVLVLDSLLCNRPPPPPGGVNPSPPDFNPSAPLTTRDRLVSQHQQGSCAGCHTVIDGIGFAFENYDAVGMWRTDDSGLPVDATARLLGTDVDGDVVGGVALAQRLAQSHEVAECVAYQWLRYSLGLDTKQINVPAARSVADEFWAAGGSFGELIVSIAKSNYFRTLQVSN